jgi:dinuclear metal center YbgI/SA1388 family protein
MKLNKLIKFLESVAPLSYQESYDNAGLIVGDPDTKIKGVLVCLDSTEAIIKEAIKRKCNVIIAHHPIVFKGLKKFNGKSYVERTVMMAIKHDICIYAIHTNLDNIYHNGVNTKIAEKLKLKNLQILSPKKNLIKLQFYLNVAQINAFQKASTKYKAPAALQNIHSLLTAKSNGKEEAAEMKYETTILQHEVGPTLQYLKNNTGAKEITHHVLPISNVNTKVGSGMIGQLEKPILTKTFFSRLKSSMELKGFRHTADLGQKIQKVAVCGGAGGFLLGQAIRAGADIFITSDYKYHEFFDADGKIIIADIGHYESERYTIELLHGLITKNFSNFAAHCTKLSTNPVFYY